MRPIATPSVSYLPTPWDRVLGWGAQRGWLRTWTDSLLMEGIRSASPIQVARGLWHWQQQPHLDEEGHRDFLRSAYLPVIDERRSSLVHVQIFCALLEAGMRLPPEEQELIAMGMSMHHNWQALIGLEKAHPFTQRQKTLSFCLLLDHAMNEEDETHVAQWLDSGDYDPMAECYLSTGAAAPGALGFTMLGHALAVADEALVWKVLTRAHGRLDARACGSVARRRKPLSVELALALEDRGWRWDEVLLRELPEKSPAQRLEGLCMFNPALAHTIEQAATVRQAQQAHHTLSQSTQAVIQSAERRRL